MRVGKTRAAKVVTGRPTPTPTGTTPQGASDAEHAAPTIVLEQRGCPQSSCVGGGPTERLLQRALGTEKWRQCAKGSWTKEGVRKRGWARSRRARLDSSTRAQAPPTSRSIPGADCQTARRPTPPPVGGPPSPPALTRSAHRPRVGWSRMPPHRPPAVEAKATPHVAVMRVVAHPSGRWRPSACPHRPPVAMAGIPSPSHPAAGATTTSPAQAAPGVARQAAETETPGGAAAAPAIADRPWAGAAARKTPRWSRSNHPHPPLATAAEGRAQAAHRRRCESVAYPVVVLPARRGPR